ncbi:MAG: antitoxin [Dehalobacter sp.]|nr:antitoxin [Dehalobacter sp.]
MPPTARTRANRKYNEKAYDRIGITVPKGDKEKIKSAADQAGESVNAFINSAIQERIAKSTEE